MKEVGNAARTVTQLLRDWRAGERAAADELLPLVYKELHVLAASSIRGERRGHTLSPTDLIGEAYLRLSAGAQPDWDDRVHFFAIAARTMRQILVDHARKHQAAKRGGGEKPVTLDEQIVSIDRAPELLALHDALEELAVLDERKARTVELHYFAGLTQEEVAKVLEVHVNTVSRELKLAEAWIHRKMSA
jgi:RNA polymerase sigma factor (TIGR02999 family)